MKLFLKKMIFAKFAEHIWTYVMPSYKFDKIFNVDKIIVKYKKKFAERILTYVMPIFSYKFASILCAVMILSGCGAKILNKGKLFTENEKVIFEKVKTKQEALNALGTPSATTMFDVNETWIYFGSTMRQTAFFTPYYEKYELNLIKFNGNNVKSRQTLTLKDKKEIEIYQGSTRIKGAKDLNPFEELIGNVGRFSAVPSAQM